MRIVIFLGPTLRVDQARLYLDAEYRSPVQQGDIVSVLDERPEVIGIIDGFFDLVPAVWHKEILLALTRGIHVLGAASMGALRAAELHPFGMVGVGHVFKEYSCGHLEDDDEVAVVHGPQDTGYVELSQAMVNIRDAFQEAAARKIISDDLAAELTSVAKRLHYSERNYFNVFKSAHALLRNLPEVPALESFVRSKRLTLKQRDAISLLKLIATFEKSPFKPLRAPFELQYTSFLDALIKDVAHHTHSLSERGKEHSPN